LSKSLANQIAVVTGASSGIGRAIALALAAEGAALFLVARRENALSAVAQTIRAADEQARVWSCPTDLSQETDIQRLGTAIERETGCLDILVHCGGAYSSGRISEATTTSFDSLYQTNVRGPFLLTKIALPLFPRGSGQIVFINSSAGLSARAGHGQFAASQHALRAVTDALREEINSHGTRVLSMHLGRTATPRMERLYDQGAKPYRPELLMQPEDVAATVRAALLLPRTAEITEIHMRPLLKSY
jgi:NADP-dependent 3-hydroxy acid dehydrogenase YdfG